VLGKVDVRAARASSRSGPSDRLALSAIAEAGRCNSRNRRVTQAARLQACSGLAPSAPRTPRGARLAGPLGERRSPAERSPGSAARSAARPPRSSFLAHESRDLDAPVPRSGREQANLVADRLHRHFLEADHSGSFPVVIGNPVAARSPGGRTASVRIVELLRNVLSSFTGECEAGAEDCVLVPAGVILPARLFDSVMPGADRQLEIFTRRAGEDHQLPVVVQLFARNLLVLAAIGLVEKR